MKDIRFGAPWGTPLKIMSLIGSAVCLGVSGMLFSSLNKTGGHDLIAAGLALIPLSLLLIAALFTVKGYRISGNALFIQRLGWATRVSLDRLVSVEHDPSAMNGSIRTFGNGGFFSFTGHFRNRALGPYRAYVTDAKNAVVIRLPERIMVVSPDSPDRFVDAVKEK